MTTELTMWWPRPSALEDLDVVVTETGWDLTAPDGSEVSDWLNYWSQDEEHRSFFEREFVSALINHIQETDGQTQDLPDQQSNHREQA